MSQTVTLRLPDGVADWLKTAAKRTGRSLNDVGVSLFEEARRVSEFAEIEFRTFGGERQACLKGLLQVWQVIEVAQQVGLDAEKTAQHFGWPTWKAQAALNYYEAFPEEVDAAIAENKAMGYEKLKRLFPHMTLSEVTLSSADEKTETKTEASTGEGSEDSKGSVQEDAVQAEGKAGVKKKVSADATKAGQ